MLKFFIKVSLNNEQKHDLKVKACVKLSCYAYLCVNLNAKALKKQKRRA